MIYRRKGPVRMAKTKSFSERTLTAQQRRLVALVLAERFPALREPDAEMNGADTVDALAKLYADLRDTGIFFQIGRK